MGQNLPYHPCPCSTVGSFFKPGRPLWESFVVAQTIRRFSSRIICFEKYADRRRVSSRKLRITLGSEKRYACLS